MIDYGIVQSTVKPEAKEIDKYSVWVNTDIREITVQAEEISHIEYEFHQICYEKDEYIAKMDEKNSYLEGQVTDMQLAMCEVYELVMPTMQK